MRTQSSKWIQVERIIRETQKAVYVEASVDTWLPKSQIFEQKQTDSVIWFNIPTWLYRKHIDAFTIAVDDLEILTETPEPKLDTTFYLQRAEMKVGGEWVDVSLSESFQAIKETAALSETLIMDTFYSIHLQKIRDPKFIVLENRIDFVSENAQATWLNQEGCRQEIKRLREEQNPDHIEFAKETGQLDEFQVGDKVRPNHKGEDDFGRVVDWTVYEGHVLAVYPAGSRVMAEIEWTGEARNVFGPRCEYDVRDLDNIDRPKKRKVYRLQVATVEDKAGNWIDATDHEFFADYKITDRIDEQDIATVFQAIVPRKLRKVELIENEKGCGFRSDHASAVWGIEYPDEMPEFTGTSQETESSPDIEETINESQIEPQWDDFDCVEDYHDACDAFYGSEETEGKSEITEKSENLKTTKKDAIADLKERLATDANLLERGILALYAMQTIAEQDSMETSELNGVGFSGADANFFSYCAQWIEKGNHLSGTFLEKARSRFGKYAKQLLSIAPELIEI